jgi:hypothetical protein|tara:strand:+ start:16004 stop:16528 length:525 start_codon:yes stop_codon:yes gene_type:complete
MANPFSGIITSEMKTLFNNMIDSLLEDSALTVECTLFYGVTKFDNCVNCLYDPIGKKSSNRYQNGGPVPFSFGGCPLCGGAGKKASIASESIKLAVIYNYKQFMDIGTPVNNPDGVIQTISEKESTPKLKRAKELQTSTDIANYGQHKFERISDPQPVGFGNNEFVFCNWRRTN